MKIKSMFVIAFILEAMLLIYGICTNQIGDAQVMNKTEEDIVNKPNREISLIVERIFIGTPNKYTVMYKDENKSILIEDLNSIIVKKTGYDADQTHIKKVVFTEIPKDQPLRVVMKVLGDPALFSNYWKWEVEFFIHNPADVEGGSWQYKKKSNPRSNPIIHSGKVSILE